MPTTSVESCGPDAAWVLSSGYGAACLDEDGWKIFDQPQESPLSRDIADVAVCADGTTWLADSKGLVSTDGETWVSHKTANRSFKAIACDPRKGVWLAADGGVYYYDGERLTRVASNLGTGEYAAQVRDVAVAADGHVWAITADSVATWDGAAWRYWEQGKEFSKDIYLSSVAVDGTGRVWVGTVLDHLLLYDGNRWSTIARESLLQPRALAVDREDRLWVGTVGGGVSVLDGTKWVTYDRGNSDLPSDSVMSITVDARGRAWLGTEWGLAVVEGKKWTVYQMSNSDIRDDRVAVIGVAGRGPALAKLQAKDPGQLRGQVVGGRSSDALRVEACVESVRAIYYGSTPCAGHAFYKSATTDRNGVFTFARLPVGRYHITVHDSEGKWRTLLEPSTLEAKDYLVEAGRTTNLGDLDISPGL